MTEWQLRYRSPLSPTKGVDDVTIGTDSAHEQAAGSPDAAAKELANHWLERHVASPSTRFVFVRRRVVATSADMRRELGKPAADAGEEDKTERTEKADKGDKAEKTEKANKAEKADKGDKPEGSGSGAATTGGPGRVGA